MEEIWKPIKGYEGLYEISNLGRVKMLPKVIKNRYYCEKIMAMRVTSRGYLDIGLRNGEGQTRFSIHRLVALSFIQNIDNKPFVNHKDGNKQNNNVSNLEWCTQQENTNHAVETGLVNFKGRNNPNSKLTDTDITTIIKLKDSYTMVYIANEYNVSYSTIKRLFRRINNEDKI